MDVREAISLLAMRGVDASKNLGGSPQLTAEDVAGAMAQLCEFAEYLLRVKYAGQTEDYHRLWAWWFSALMDKWGANGGKVEQVAIQSLAEHVASNRCRQCNGVAELLIEDKTVLCPRCNGTGFEYAPTSLPDNWQGRLNWSRGRLNEIEVNALDKVRQQLFDA